MRGKLTTWKDTNPCCPIIRSTSRRANHCTAMTDPVTCLDFDQNCRKEINCWNYLWQKIFSRLCLIFRGELRTFLFRVSFGKEEEIVILFQSKFLLLLFIQLQLRERDVLLSSRSFLIRCRILEEEEKTCLSSFDHLAAKGWNSTLARAGTSPIFSVGFEPCWIIQFRLLVDSVVGTGDMLRWLF